VSPPAWVSLRLGCKQRLDPVPWHNPKHDTDLDHSGDVVQLEFALSNSSFQASEIFACFRLSPILWDMGHSDSCCHRPFLTVRRRAHFCELETFVALRFLAANRESLLSAPDGSGLIFWMAVGPPIQSQVYVLGLDSSFGSSSLCLCLYTYPQPMGVSTQPAGHNSLSDFVLLWLGLPAAGWVLRSIADHNALLCLRRIFFRRVLGPKSFREGSTNHRN
jgi:hypothetical protein